MITKGTYILMVKDFKNVLLVSTVRVNPPLIILATELMTTAACGLVACDNISGENPVALEVDDGKTRNTRSNLPKSCGGNILFEKKREK